MSNISVLFVCLGNICRSPTAHAVFQALVEDSGLSEHIEVDSAGTGDWHIGHAPDQRTCAVAAEHGYDMSSLRARLVDADDFDQFDYILAMDHDNLANLKAICPADYAGSLELMLDYTVAETFAEMDEVPDPYYGGDDGFSLVLELVEDACAGLLEHIRARL